MTSRIHKWRIYNGSIETGSELEVEYHERERAYYCSCCGRVQHGENFCIHVIAVLVRRMRVTELASTEI